MLREEKDLLYYNPYLIQYDPHKIDKSKENLEYYVVQISKYSYTLECNKDYKDKKLFDKFEDAKFYKQHLRNVKNVRARIVKRSVETKIVK